MKLKSIEKLNFKNKKVLLRVNFDVPLKNGSVADASRILAHLPTINFLLKQKAQIILISHLGDPSKVNSMKLKIQRYGLRPVFNYCKKIIPSLEFIESLEWPTIKREIQNKKIVLLENLRFYPGEKDNDKNFAKFLASLADIYINDAFPVCHRNHASVAAVTKYLPSYAGLLLEKEIKNLSEALVNPQHPFIVLMGGAKISTKVPVLESLAKKADKILVGGALANDLLKNVGYNVGESLVEKGITKIPSAVEKKLILPTDVTINSKLKTQNSKIKFKTENLKITQLNQLKNNNFRILDIGKETIKLFAAYLKGAKMIVWNGPMGLFEEKPFDQGTAQLFQEILKNKRTKIIIGGGETIAALKIKNKKEKLKNNIFISTGGGAMLEFLSGNILPGIKPLLK
jgi:phosphoglycerate kinase